MSNAPRVGIVTGAGWGIGLAVARRLTREGHLVVLNDLDAKRLGAAVESLPSDQAVGLAGDILDGQTPAALVATAVERFGGLDMLVNNVGGRGVPPGMQADAQAFEREIDLCLTSGWRMTRAAVDALGDGQGGSVVFVSSSAGRYTSDMAGVGYCAGKAGVLGLSRAIAAEYGARGIRSNAVAPGSTLTEQGRADWDALAADERARIEGAVPLGRLAEPEDIADVIAFLLSDDARYVTGTTVDVNGGYLMS